MSWKDHASFDEKTHKLLYKGVDIGLSRELIQDLNSSIGMDISDDMIEQLYNSCITVIRDKRIDELLGNS